MSRFWNPSGSFKPSDDDVKLFAFFVKTSLVPNNRTKKWFDILQKCDGFVGIRPEPRKGIAALYDTLELAQRAMNEGEERGIEFANGRIFECFIPRRDYNNIKAGRQAWDDGDPEDTQWMEEWRQAETDRITREVMMENTRLINSLNERIVVLNDDKAKLEGRCRDLILQKEEALKKKDEKIRFLSKENLSLEHRMKEMEDKMMNRWKENPND